jgi:transposase
MPESEYAALIGIDWATQSHSMALHDLNSGCIEDDTVSSDPSAIDAWIRKLQKRFPDKKVAVCVELSRGALISQLARFPFIDIYPLNPITSARFRKAFRPSGAKDDRTDARLHLCILTKHRDQLLAWSQLDPQDQSIQLLCENRRKLVSLQVDLRNRLASVLQGYFPQALTLAGTDLASSLASAFLLKWPDLASLKRAKRETIRKFYYAHGCRRGDLIEKRLDAIEQAKPVTEDSSLIEPEIIYMQSLVAQLGALRRSLTNIEAEISKTFQAHPDAEIWKSFPGAGEVLAPRLTAAWTSDRERFAAARDMQTFSGAAPVLIASGKSHTVLRRFHRPRFLHQSFWEHAKNSTLYCPWAKAYVEDQVARGKKRSSAYRSLAFKWQRIMFACWKNRTPYDEAKYQAALMRSGSPHHQAEEAAS